MSGIGWMRASLAIVLLITLPLLGGCFPPPIHGGAGGVLGVGASASGTIVAPGARVRYTLNIAYPRPVTVYVSGHGLDPTVALYNAAGGRLGYNDDGGNGLDSQLVMSLAPGSYIVEVSGYSSSTGPYTLTIR